ncbi:MAG: glutathione synthase, partial [Rhodospirillaceae bacterium]|nr:glutathione synthase [Rhodospirillaceae bacterium]
MALSVAIQMDPIHSIDIGADSTFVLAMEAQARGHTLHYYTPDRLRFRDGVLSAPVQRLTVRAERGNHADLGEARLADLSEMDVILLRQDPPFDLAY